MSNSTAQDERKALADRIEKCAENDVLWWSNNLSSMDYPTQSELRSWGELMLQAVAALRAEPARGAEEMRERCAKAAEADRGVDDCPYSNDKPGDPTWHHTDDDVCPRCRKVGKDSGSACVGIAKHRIAAAIRALPASHEGGGDA